MARQGLAIAGGVIGGYFGGPAGAQLGMALGGAIGGAIDPEKIQGPRLGEPPVQTGRDGVPIPVAWGREHSAGNIIIKNDLVVIEVEEKAGKGGGSVTVTERATRTFAIGIMRSIEGPIAGILRIWENDKLVFDESPNPSISAEDTAAYKANLTIYLGDEDQLPDPELESQWGVGTTPAFRGLPYCVWNNYDITDFGQAIPQIRFEIQTSRDLGISSRPYPLEVVEGWDSTFGPDKVRQFDMPIEGWDTTASLNTIGIAALRELYTAELEGWDTTTTLDSIILDSVVVPYTAELEGWDNSDVITSITLDPRLIEYVYENEGWEQTDTLTGITLT